MKPAPESTFSGARPNFDGLTNAEYRQVTLQERLLIRGQVDPVIGEALHDELVGIESDGFDLTGFQARRFKVGPGIAERLPAGERDQLNIRVAGDSRCH